MTRVVVTGGSGRLGRSVVAVLAAAGYDVVSVDRAARDDLPARQFAHDLTDGDATRALFDELRPDVVVHLAAIAVPFSLPESEIYATNTALAFSVIDATIACGAGSLLIASSPTVIGYNAPAGWTPDYLPLDEEHPHAPWNAYSLSKDAVERMVAMMVRAHGDAVRFGVFRPCYVIAPEEWTGSPTQQGHTIRQRLDDPALSAVALFNYLDARDGGEFVVRWIENASTTANGSVFFVAAPDSLVREPVGPALARLVPGIGSAAETLDADGAVFSSAKAEAVLGWRAHRTWRTQLDDPDSPRSPDARYDEVSHA